MWWNWIIGYAAVGCMAFGVFAAVDQEMKPEARCALCVFLAAALWPAATLAMIGAILWRAFD